VGNVTIIQGEAIDFQGTASDSDGTVASHQWALGDGTTYEVEDPGSYVYTDAGTYNVSYRVTDDDGASSVADTRTVTVQAETPPPSGSRTVVFHSDWSTATGTSNNAVMDQGKAKSWTEYGGASNNQLRVVTASSTGLNWPAGMANVLQVNANNVRWGQVGFRIGDNYFEPPRTAGESLYYRMYFSLVIPAGWGGDRFTHGWNDGGEGIGDGSFNFSWSIEEVGSGYRFRARTGVGGSDPYVLWDHSRDAQRNRVYRVEYQITRVDASNMRLHIRIYDESKTLIIDDSSYSSLQTPYGTRLDSNPLIPLNHRDGWDGFKYLRVGTNGYADGLGTGGIHSYFGGVAICTGDWCGPYSSGM
jgi:PKD repeat protein